MGALGDVLYIGFVVSFVVDWEHRGFCISILVFYCSLLVLCGNHVEISRVRAAA